jgi:hypothetical protein
MNDVFPWLLLVFILSVPTLLVWLDVREGNQVRRDREERGHGVIPTAMTQDMMDGDE